MCPLTLALIVALPALVHSNRRAGDKVEGAVGLSVESDHFEQQNSVSGLTPGKIYMCAEKWAKHHLVMGSTGHVCLIDEDQARTMIEGIKALPDKNKPKFYIRDVSKCAAKSKPHLFKVCPELKDNNRVHYSGRVFLSQSCFRETPATWPAKKESGKELQIKLVVGALDDKDCKAQLKLQKQYQGKVRRIRKKGADDMDEVNLIEADEDDAPDDETPDDDDDDENPEEPEDNVNVDGDAEMSFEDRISMWKQMDAEATD